MNVFSLISILIKGYLNDVWKYDISQQFWHKVFEVKAEVNIPSLCDRNGIGVDKDEKEAEIEITEAIQKARAK